MRPSPSLIAAGALLVAAGFAQAATGGFGLAFDTLYEVDLDRQSAARIGEAGYVAGRLLGNLSGLSMTADGALYAVTSGAGVKQLVRIDPATGAATGVGNLELDDTGSGPYDALDLGMTASCDGDLWLASASTGKLWRLDPASAEVQLVGDTGYVITGLVEHGGVLYGVGGKGENLFYEIDQETGVASVIGSLGSELAPWVNAISPAFDENGVLWAVISYVPPRDDGDIPEEWNDLALIDPTSGSLSIVGPLIGPSSLREIGMRGFTLGPPECRAQPTAGAVPVPADGVPGLALLALLLAALGSRHPRLRGA